MQCDRIRSWLANYAVGGLKPSARAAVEAHLAECPACRRELAALGNTAQLVADLGLDEPPADLWRRIERGIAATPQRLSLGERLRTWLAEPGGTWRPAPLGWAVAAAVLVLAAFAGPRVSEALWPVAPRAEAVTIAWETDPDTSEYVERHIAAGWHVGRSDDAALGLALASLPKPQQGDDE
jgi:anti-sigma factor RsiW